MAHLQPGEGVERAERLVHQQHRGTQHQRTHELLDRLGLTREAAQRYPQQLSGGIGSRRMMPCSSTLSIAVRKSSSR